MELYGLQQELARHQMNLEKNHDEFSQMRQIRNQTEQELNDVRQMYKERQLAANNEKKKGEWLLK